MKKIITAAAFAASLFTGCTNGDIVAFAKAHAIKYAEDHNISAKTIQICWNDGTEQIECDGIDALCESFSKDVIKSREGELHVRIIYAVEKAQCSFNYETIDLY